MLNEIQLKVAEHYKGKYSEEAVNVINQYFGVYLYSEEEFDKFYDNIFIPSEYLGLYVDGVKQVEIPRWKAHKLLNEYFANLGGIIDDFIDRDEYCDAIEIFNNDKHGKCITFCTWCCGAPEEYTYTLDGECVRSYNAERDCDDDWYDEQISVTDEDDEVTDLVISNTIIDADFVINETQEVEEREERNMVTTTQTTQKDKRIEAAAEAKAKSIVGVVKDNLKGASEAALGLCENVAKEARIIAAMSQQEAENYIRRKFGMKADKFIDWISNELHIELKGRQKGASIFAPVGATASNESTSRLERAIADFNKVRTEGELKGWKKAKEILKAVFGIVFAVFIEAAKVVLKLVFSLAVGVIRLGAVAITTLASCVSTVNNDVVKPVAKANTERKGRKAAQSVGVNAILK